MSPEQTRTYDRARSVVFLKTNELFGGLSNMAGGYPLHVQGVRILTSEALYQACRFPHFPEVQRLIIGQASPMTAKMKSKPHRKDSRPDWDQVRVKVMRWCLRVKLVQNWSTFSELLLRTGDRPIVEESRKDDFWGAKPVDEQSLVGMNVLGRLLMELREAVKSGGHDAFLRIEPPAIPNFMLFDRPIETIADRGVATVVPTGADAGSREAEQTSLFDHPVVRERPPPVYLPISAEHSRLARLNPYPAMKDSGVEWLGEVPAHWQAKRLKGAATYWVSNVDKVAAEDEMPVRLCNYTDVYYNDHIRPSMDLMETTATSEEIRRFGLKVGDVVITKDSEEWSDIAVPALVVESAPDLVCGYHLAIVRPRETELLGRFLLRVFQACAVNQQFQMAATGVTRYGLPKSSIGEAWIPLPSAPEQRAIADFLDRETAQIDTLVAKKLTLIERLKEKRTALISRAVTRGLPPNAARAAGLDPHPKLKPSGIDWLGEIPKHWDVLPFTKYVADRSDYRGKTPEKTQDGVFLVTAKNVRMGYIDYDSSQEYVAENEYDEIMRRGLPKKGDILFTTEAPLGNVALIDREDIALAQRIIRFRMNPHSFDATFALYGMMSDHFQDQLQSLSTGSTAEGLKASKLPILRIIAPPLTEQKIIGEFLDRETARMDGMVAKVEAAIERLQEYRKALITAAVTGKIDVRRVGERSQSAMANTESARMEA